MTVPSMDSFDSLWQLFISDADTRHKKTDLLLVWHWPLENIIYEEKKDSNSKKSVSYQKKDGRGHRQRPYGLFSRDARQMWGMSES